MAILKHINLIGKQIHDGGILLFFQENMSSKLIESQSKIVGFFVELNLRRKKWLSCCPYNRKYSHISHHLSKIRKALDVLTSNHDDIILMRDFNPQRTYTALSGFCELYNLKNIV